MAPVLATTSAGPSLSMCCDSNAKASLSSLFTTDVFAGGKALYRRDLNDHGYAQRQHDEEWAARTAYTCVSLFCTLVLALMLGSRAKHFSLHHISGINFMRFLTITLYVTALNFVAAGAIIETGMSMNTPALCRAGTLVCLSFYLISKALMYMFIIERAHSIRAPYTRRLDDWVWCGWMFVLATGFVSLAVASFLQPVAQMGEDDGVCRIGLPRKASITLVMFDIFINFSLTGVFLWLLRPLLAFHQTGDPERRSYFRFRIFKYLKEGGSQIPSACSWISFRFPQMEGPYRPALNMNLVRAVESLVWKTLIGTVLIVIPTIVNLSLLYHMAGKEQGWLCFTICTLDVTWAVSVIHWLTVDPLDVDNRSIGQLQSSPRPSRGSEAAMIAA